MSQHWPVGNFRVGGNTPTIQTPDMSEEPHHRPRRGLRNLAQGRGPQRQVFVAGVEDKFASANAVLGELQNML